MEAIRTFIDGKIDFQGQRLADRIMQEMLVLGAGLAFLLGYFTQNLQLCMVVYGFTFLLTTILTVPAWPFYNRCHVEWLPNLPKENNDDDQQQQSLTSKSDPTKSVTENQPKKRVTTIKTQITTEIQ